MSTKTGTVVSAEDQFKTAVSKSRERVNTLRRTKGGNPDVEVVNQELIALGRTKVKNNATLKVAMSSLEALNQKISKLEK